MTSRSATYNERVRPWYLYILQCRDNSFYVGITTNINLRIQKHNSGKGSRYVYSKRPVKLMFLESYKTESEARKREIQIKGWTRRKKQLLIEGRLLSDFSS